MSKNDRIEVQLCDRTKQPLHLTGAGQVFTGRESAL